MLINDFNKFVGAISELTGANYEPAKGVRCYNIKTGIYNVASLTLVYGVAVALFSNFLAGLVISGLSFGAKVFVQAAMNETFLGSGFKYYGDFLYKPFMA